MACTDDSAGIGAAATAAGIAVAINKIDTVNDGKSPGATPRVQIGPSLVEDRASEKILRFAIAPSL